MPLPIQNARISKLIHEAYNVVGRYRARIDEVVVPVAIVDNLTQGGAFPEVRRAASKGLVSAVALERAVWRFETPNNILAVIRQLSFRVTLTGRILVHFGSSIVAPGTFAPKAFIDGRLRNRGEEPAANFVFGTQVAVLGVEHMFYKVISTNGLFVPVEWPIGQKNAFDFVEFLYDSENEAGEMGIVWDEYLIQP